jgi:hypothetical protein
MKKLEISQMENLQGARNCRQAEGVVAGALATSWVLGPLGFAVSFAIAGVYYLHQCGSSDY